ncbi:pyridine nucleotide-disulfide oxidoreductase [Thioclava marina]|uniref:Pyridine nucleotide-disulfide oxidoreductase n=1 Tax=Thioclava marina TaxID=1915077 RepID=A0ABX3MRJ4_9RHOB|nr:MULTISPECIES: FAD/NAD(P)-binding oxidoreductase [Thioclava]OOY12663.1 pyridine nucleotide-disulfide oxidoreductase [Thioclava marina]OOY26571.1 pyridine nucleotide-disulfide oxidoreductase [Thioclava sp. L04-15]TNE89680.1 MAG: NAD(P)/FAD-dependent oxidoreductase [Paracoccaceae bacterium]
MIKDVFSPSRRGFLGLAGGAAALSAMGAAKPATAAVQTKARVVIVGSGAAGTGLVNRLVQRLDGAQITIVDGRKQHWYQPGFTLIAAGLKNADYSVSGTGDWLPTGVNWVEDYAAAIDPEAQRVTTVGGEAIEYDYLVVATGLKLDWGAIEGFSLDQVGQNGLGAVYAGPDYAAKTWAAMDQFTEKGGVALFGRPATEMKCAGAPLKYTFLTDDYLRKKGTREASQIIYAANNKGLFSVPVVNEKVKLLFGDRGFETRYDHVLTGIDAGTRTAYFRTPEQHSVDKNGIVTVTPASERKIEFDFTNVIPPMVAPDVVRESGLAWEDKWVGQGWLEVDQQTLRHRRYANVFGLGDIAGVPKGKTAASVKWQIPVVEDHLVAAIEGKDGTEIYNGYTSCPLITKVGRAMLVEFDYENRLTPSFPGVIAPLEELWISWLMKEIALKPTYNAMLRGKA